VVVSIGIERVLRGLGGAQQAGASDTAYQHTPRADPYDGTLHDLSRLTAVARLNGRANLNAEERTNR